MRITQLTTLAAGIVLAVSAQAASDALPAAAVKAEAKITGAGLLAHITTLASDDFEGRSPGTRGEKVTIAYIADQFRKLGLKPAAPGGSWFQDVPLRSTLSKPRLRYTVGGKSTELSFPEDFVAWAPRNAPAVNVKSDLVFVGYGVTAPEYGWDDYKGMDMKGKTLVMLINDPAIPDPKNPGQLDPSMFGGKAMTYYGRWTYKYEIAAKLGAAGAIIVHETGPASYPYEVVRNSWSRENFTVDAEGGTAGYPEVPGWIQLDRAKELFRAAGLDFDQLKQAALRKDFKPVPLNASVEFDVANTGHATASHNVVAKIEGSDPKLKHEYLVFSAHWDHFGIDESLPGPRTRQIYHGARDNASGVAALLELAKAYKALKSAPKRTLVFVATTAEERGLLGAQYYATHPLYPLERTLVNINIDGINTWGRTADISITGSGKSSADDVVRRVAKLQGRTAIDDARTESGSFYRADQFEMAKAGVPGVYLGSGIDFIGKPPGYAKQKSAEYVGEHYHKVSDVVRPDWDMAGAEQDVRLLFQVGYDIAQGRDWPQWAPNAEFKAARDAMLKGKR
jgi:Zn-dependent M28 family amino/carboxypeptidase